MTSYLQSNQSGPMPFTGTDICADLGIDPAAFAFTIDGFIAVEVINSRPPVRHEVWWVSAGERFDEESKHGACHPDHVSAPFQFQGREFVACTYEPRDWAVAIIRKNVIQRARHAEDIHLARAVSEADERKRTAARVAGREQFRASLTAEVA